MMTIASKLIVSCLIAGGSVLLIRHGETALRPALPKDMPGNAAFVASGFDLADNEAKGEWIACRSDSEHNADLCRVTDARGSVIYEGEFLPVNGSAPLPTDQLTVSTSRRADLWVAGPTEQSPVPVIPLANGTMLVPSDDLYGLSARWVRNPEEFQRLDSVE